MIIFIGQKSYFVLSKIPMENIPHLHIVPVNYQLNWTINPLLNARDETLPENTGRFIEKVKEELLK